MSTIKVDTIQKNGGASEISIDKLGGVTAAGSMIVVGEGGSTTTNLQQGLAKAWSRTLADGSGIEDSFNIGSLTDSATGKQFHTFTNAMNNDDYASQTSVTNNNIDQQWTDSQTTTVCRTLAFHDSAYVDVKQSLVIMGDLA